MAAGAAVDKAENRGLPPLFMAAMNGHPEMVATLLFAGADKGVKMRWGTPLEVAQNKGHAEVVALLQ